MRKLVIFIVSAGPNVFAENIRETIESLSRNVGVDDHAFFWVVDGDLAEAAIREAAAPDRLLAIERTKGTWADDFNSFMDARWREAEYLLISHDDVVLQTPGLFDKSMEEIEGASEPIGWITFTNTHYHPRASNSVRGGFYDDRLLFEAFECHRGDGKLDYPARAVKTYGPYSHLNLIRFDAMRKVGPCPNWTKYTMLVDEHWALESLVKGHANVWVPSVLYDHPNPKQATRRKLDLRFEAEAHAAFRAKWGFDTPFADETVKGLVSRHPRLAHLASRNSFDWTYLRGEADLQRFRLKRYYSQWGEDGIIEEILRRAGLSSGWFVEFGAKDGQDMSNARFLLDREGWSGIYIERDHALYQRLAFGVAQEFKGKVYAINAEVGSSGPSSLDWILSSTPIPREFELLSIDIDGYDYWVWKAFQGYFPKVVVIEYNSHFEPTESKAIGDEPGYKYACDQYYGASALALRNLATSKGYALVAYTEKLNLFFVRKDLMSGFKEMDVAEVKKIIHKDPSPKKMIDV